MADVDFAKWQEAMWTFSTFSASSLVKIAGSGKKHLATYILSLCHSEKHDWSPLTCRQRPERYRLVRLFANESRVEATIWGRSLPTFAQMSHALFLTWILPRKCPLKFSSVVTDFIALLSVFERRSTSGFTLHSASLPSSWRGQQYESALLGSLKRRRVILLHR